MTPIQKQRASFYRFAMSLSMTLFIATGFILIQDTQAMTMKERVCQKGYIGYEYNPRLEVRCRGLWDQWSEEIKVSFNQK